jgi:hypothetical protein
MAPNNSGVNLTHRARIASNEDRQMMRALLQELTTIT